MIKISNSEARKMWIASQRLDVTTPFGAGTEATLKAIEHLGYVQIDTINVIERCHHHILYNRIPDYKKSDLHHHQTIEKSVFEYWTHALAYIPVKDFRFFIQSMKGYQKTPQAWLASVTKEEMKKVFELIKKEGPLSIRDIGDDELVEKTHAWGSRKPSKKALQLGFFSGRLMISERLGMLKKYELTSRHFNWEKIPKVATEKEINEYLLERSLRTQSLVSLESICHLEPSRKPVMKKLIETKVKNNQLIQVDFGSSGKNLYWINPLDLERKITITSDKVHILSPFDPLIIQRKRLKDFFDYDHRFEAYIPQAKRLYGYFALPVLRGSEIIAVLDLKTDRKNKKLLIQNWTWPNKCKTKENKLIIEEELNRFEKFQLEI